MAASYLHLSVLDNIGAFSNPLRCRTEFGRMGKRDRLARAARKRQKASVQALGRDVGGVDEAVKGHKRQQEERAELYRQAEVNIAENSATFRKSGWKQNDVAMRMSMSCPMCSSETKRMNNKQT